MIVCMCMGVCVCECVCVCVRSSSTCCHQLVSPCDLPSCSLFKVFYMHAKKLLVKLNANNISCLRYFGTKSENRVLNDTSIVNVRDQNVVAIHVWGKEQKKKQREKCMQNRPVRKQN